MFGLAAPAGFTTEPLELVVAEAVGKLVMVSTNIRRTAIYPEMLAQQLQMGPAAVEFRAAPSRPRLLQLPAFCPSPSGRAPRG